MKTVYTVVGVTGHYEDWTQWIVRSFTSKDRAQTLCKLLNDWAKQEGIWRGPGSHKRSWNTERRDPQIFGVLPFVVDRDVEFDVDEINVTEDHEP